MSDNVIFYIEMCQREGTSLQAGMNFGLGGNHSVILMSLRANAPYRDRLEDGGTKLVYEGHDHPKGAACPNPKVVDQPERVRVYEKIRTGIWSYNGIFHLVDSWKEKDDFRTVFKFKLVAVEGDEDFAVPPQRNVQRRRVIPSSVKLAVWERDGGRCTICGATDELHFDHDLPWSKGGTSISEENVQLLCARHNLGKRDQII